jgi:transposase
MAKRRFTLSERQEKELQRTFRETKDGATRIRYQAVRLYGQGYPVPEVCQITGCNRTSLMEWCRKYRQEGVLGLTDRRGGPHSAKLKPEQLEDLRARLHQYMPRDVLGPGAHTPGGQHWTVEDVAQVVQRWYGISWESRTSYHTVLARCGFTYQRTEKVYKSRRGRDVAEFAAQVEKN